MSMIEELVARIKTRADRDLLGMIVCHNGVVRGKSREGAKVSHLDVMKNDESWDRILEDVRKRTGIVGVEAHLFTGRRDVGQNVMVVVVGGDIRENVFPALEETVNRLKKEGVSKREWLLQ